MRAMFPSVLCWSKILQLFGKIISVDVPSRGLYVFHRLKIAEKLCRHSLIEVESEITAYLRWWWFPLLVKHRSIRSTYHLCKRTYFHRCHPLSGKRTSSPQSTCRYQRAGNCLFRSRHHSRVIRSSMSDKVQWSSGLCDMWLCSY